MDKEIFDPFSNKRDSFEETHETLASRESSYEIPEVYKQVYRVLRIRNEYDRIPRNVLDALLQRSRLDSHKREHILKLLIMEFEDYSLDRAGLNTALGLMALAQQNKSIDMETLLELKEIPCPKLYDLDSIVLEDPIRRESPVMDSSRRSSPTLPSLDASTLGTHHDKIQVEIAPERRGTLFKHTMYLVSSTLLKVTVIRRYNDFLALHEILSKKYTFRMLLDIPPKKKLGSEDEAFIEKRKKGLLRYMNFLVSHPILQKDEVLRVFLTDKEEIQTSLKLCASNVKEEFVTSDLALHPDRYLPEGIIDLLKRVRGHVESLYGAFTTMQDAMVRVTRNYQDCGSELSRFSQSLKRTFFEDAENFCWIHRCGNCIKLCLGLELLGETLESDATYHKEMAQINENEFLEHLTYYIMLLIALSAAFDRYEKYGLKQYQNATTHRLNENQKLENARSKGKPDKELEKLEGQLKLAEQEEAYYLKRNNFGLLCLLQELQFFHYDRSILSKTFQEYSRLRSQQLSEDFNWMNNLLSKEDVFVAILVADLVGSN